MGSCLSSTLLYGESGSTKTSQIASLAKWIKLRTGKRTRLYTSEPGGVGTIQHYIDAGIIDVWDISNRPNAFETLDFAARGYWPDSTGKLVAPTDETWKEFGLFAHDSMSGNGEMLLEELRVKGAANEIVGAEKAPQQFTSGTLRVAGSNQTHYGIVQGRVRKAINDSQRLPVHVLWTARELKVDVTDELTGKVKEVYGPLLAGQAMTASIPAWFGNCIHLNVIREKALDPATKKEADKLVRKAYFVNHYVGDNKAAYLAKLRIPPELVSEMPTEKVLDADLSSMVWLFDKMDELKTKAKDLTLAQVMSPATVK